jgi:hypothetical protein
VSRVALGLMSVALMTGGTSPLAGGAPPPPISSIFGAEANVALGIPRPFGITHKAADLDGDGDVDLAVTTEGTSTDRAGGKLVFLQNDGSGNFTVPAGETLPLLLPADTGNPNTVSVGRGLAAQDVNGDGKPDLVVADAGQGQSSPPGPSRTDAPGWVLVYLNTNTTAGDIFFSRLPAMAVGRRPLGVALADFNEDGKVDVGIDNEDSDAAQLLLGNGDGTFTIAQTVSFKVNPLEDPNVRDPNNPDTPAICDSPHFPAAGDLTGDGNVDLLIPCNNNGVVGSTTPVKTGVLMLMAGNGAGQLGTPQVINAGLCNAFATFPATSCRPHVPHVADVNDDGQEDITIADTGPRGSNPRVTALRNQGGGVFVDEAGSPYTATDVDQALTSFQVTEHISGRRDGSADNDVDILSTSSPRGFKPSTPKPWSHLVLHQNDGGRAGLNVRCRVIRCQVNVGTIGGPRFVQAPGSPYVIDGVGDGDPLLQELTTGDFNGDGKLDAAVVWIDTCDSTAPPCNAPAPPAFPDPTFNIPRTRTIGNGFVAVLLHN